MLPTVLSMLLLQFCALPVTVAFNCKLPEKDDVEQELINAVIDGIGEGGSPTIKSGPFYVCQVQGTIMGTYQELSVIMEYTTNVNKVGQFEMLCQSNDWIRVKTSFEPQALGYGITAYDGSIDLWTNCSSCNKNAGNRQHCIGCNPNCNQGLMRCTGSSTSIDACCAAFEDDGICIPDTECSADNFVANTENNFTCSCNIDSSSCDPGYNFTSNNTGCYCVLSNICMTQPSPCNNNGSCTLNSPPNNFTCNCTGTDYTGDTCEVEITTSTTLMATSTSSTTTMVSMATTNVSTSKTTTVSTSKTTTILSTATGGGILFIPISSTSSSTMNTQVTMTASSTAALVSSDVPDPFPTPEQRSIGKPLLAVIITTILIALLLLISLIVLIIYIVYAIVPFGFGRTVVTHVKLKDTDPLNGSAYSNPIYINPEDIT